MLKEIPDKYKISDPNAYILGDAQPEEYTNAFKPEKVKWGLEIKATGDRRKTSKN